MNAWMSWKKRHAEWRVKLFPRVCDINPILSLLSHSVKCHLAHHTVMWRMFRGGKHCRQIWKWKMRRYLASRSHIYLVTGKLALQISTSYPRTCWILLTIDFEQGPKCYMSYSAIVKVCRPGGCSAGTRLSGAFTRSKPPPQAGGGSSQFWYVILGWLLPGRLAGIYMDLACCAQHGVNG